MSMEKIRWVPYTNATCMTRSVESDIEYLMQHFSFDDGGITQEGIDSFLQCIIIIYARVYAIRFYDTHEEEKELNKDEKTKKIGILTEKIVDEIYRRNYVFFDTTLRIAFKEKRSLGFSKVQKEILSKFIVPEI